MLRQQILEILFGFGMRQLLKDKSQVGIGFQTVGFGGLDQAEEGGTGPGPIGAAGKQPVLSSHHKGADSVFHQVVVGLSIGN